MSTQKEIEDTLRYFTKTEDSLIKRLGATGPTTRMLPERLLHWRMWICDPQIYLNQLRCFVEDAEKLHAKKNT